MNGNILPSQRAAVVGVIDPDANVAGAVSTVWINMADFHNLMAIIKAGDLGALATLDAKLEQAQDAAGTGVKDIVGKAITQLTQAGVNDSNNQAIINLRDDELDINGAFTHARLTMTVGTATSDTDGTVLGLLPRYGPADTKDLASVVEIVA